MKILKFTFFYFNMVNECLMRETLPKQFRPNTTTKDGMLVKSVREKDFG